MSSLLKEMLEQIDIIDQSHKDTVNGYLREMEHQFEVIPSIVFHLILAFFCKCDEYFAEAGDNVELSNDRMTVKKTGFNSWNNTTYGYQWIDSTKNMIVKWEFKIDNNTAIATAMRFAILSKDTDCNTSFHDEVKPSYIYNIAGNLLANNVYLSDTRQENLSCKCATNDSVIIVLDLIKKQISIIDMAKDEEPMTKLLFPDVETGEGIRYKIAVSMVEFGTQITFKGISYEVQ